MTAVITNKFELFQTSHIDFERLVDNEISNVGGRIKMKVIFK